MPYWLPHLKTEVSIRMPNSDSVTKTVEWFNTLPEEKQQAIGDSLIEIYDLPEDGKALEEWREKWRQRLADK